MVLGPANPGALPGLRLLRLWYACGAVLLFAVLIVSLLPVPASAVAVGDKVSHLLTYSVLCGWFSLLARSSRALAGIVIALIAYGMMIEFLQGLTGYRYAEWGDVLANVTGCLLGTLAYLGPFRRGFLQLDNK